LTPVTMRLRTHSVAPNRRRGRIALHMTFGVIVVFVGFLGTLDHSGMRRVVASWINIHALFGALLFALVVARLQWCLESRPLAGAGELRELTHRRTQYFLGTESLKELKSLQPPVVIDLLYN